MELVGGCVAQSVSRLSVELVQLAESLIVRLSGKQTKELMVRELSFGGLPLAA